MTRSILPAGYLALALCAALAVLMTSATLLP